MAPVLTNIWIPWKAYREQVAALHHFGEILYEPRLSPDVEFGLRKAAGFRLDLV